MNADILIPFSDLLEQIADLPRIVKGDIVEWGYNQIPAGTGTVTGWSGSAINHINRNQLEYALTVKSNDGTRHTIPYRQLPKKYAGGGYYIKKIG